MAMLLALCSCGADTPAEKRAKEAASTSLPYPSSAEFRRVRLGSLSGLVCGEVSGKDLSGKDTGYRRFSWNNNTGYLAIEGGSSPSGDRELDLNQAQVTDSLISIGCES
jgi:hypothetical protein